MELEVDLRQVDAKKQIRRIVMFSGMRLNKSPCLDQRCSVDAGRAFLELVGSRLVQTFAIAGARAKSFMWEDDGSVNLSLVMVDAAVSLHLAVVCQGERHQVGISQAVSRSGERPVLATYVAWEFGTLGLTDADSVFKIMLTAVSLACRVKPCEEDDMLQLNEETAPGACFGPLTMLRGMTPYQIVRNARPRDADRVCPTCVRLLRRAAWNFAVVTHRITPGESAAGFTGSVDAEFASFNNVMMKGSGDVQT